LHSYTFATFQRYVLYCLLLFFFFFFQAEDGIRDFHVTGVQTCALPICAPRRRARDRDRGGAARRRGALALPLRPHRRGRAGAGRSEERRIGKECRSRWSRVDLKKKQAVQSSGRVIKLQEHYDVTILSI